MLGRVSLSSLQGSGTLRSAIPNVTVGNSANRRQYSRKNTAGVYTVYSPAATNGISNVGNNGNVYEEMTLAPNEYSPLTLKA